MADEKIVLRESDDRGRAGFGWLESRHTFSFGDYHDPSHTGFRSLRVINEDRVQPGKGFGAHAHRDMEIISYVVEGELEHKDSMGNGSVISAGCFQKITAGTGITHSEFNPSVNKIVHFLQIWILPRERGLTPSYSELDLSGQAADTGLRLVASPRKEKGTILINQDVMIYSGRLNSVSVNYHVDDHRGLWFQMISGRCSVNGQALSAGDGLSVEGFQDVAISAEESGEFILFDMK